MVRITNAAGLSDAILCAAMADAFSDYAIPLKLDEAGFAFMMQQRGLDREASRVAFVDGEVAAIWLVSIRQGRGYLISSGTRPAFRSRGMARALAVDCLAGFRDAGVGTFQTEVLRANETAAGLYRSLGMTTARALDCYVVAARADVAVRQVSIEAVSWSGIAADAAKLRDWRPSWQNDDLSIAAIADHLLCLAIHDDDGLAGYSIVSPASGAVFQMGVRGDVRRRGMGTALVQRMHAELPDKPLRFTNVQHDDAGFRGFMASVAAVETQGQFELMMAL